MAQRLEAPRHLVVAPSSVTAAVDEDKCVHSRILPLLDDGREASRAPPRASGSGPACAEGAEGEALDVGAGVLAVHRRPAVDGIDEQAPDDGVDRGRVGIGIAVGEVAGGGSGGERRAQRGAQFGDRLVAGRVEHPGHRGRDEHPGRLAVARVVAEGEDLVDPRPHAGQRRSGEIDVIGEALVRSPRRCRRTSPPAVRPSSRSVDRTPACPARPRRGSR